MRSLRVFSWETRLAVRLATRPELNSRRTLAMSICREMIGTPLARISLTPERSHCRMMSRSWIIRSRMTSMSSERGEKEPRRWTSMNMRFVDQPAGVLRPPD